MPLYRSLVLLATVVVLFLASGCEESSETIAPDNPLDATVVLDVEARGFGTLDPVPSNAFRVRILAPDGSLLREVTGAFSEDPSRTFGPYTVPMPASTVSAARVEFEVLSREGDNETVLWSGVLPDVTLDAGSIRELSLTAYRGPLGQLELSSILLEGVPDTIGIGESFQAEATGSPTSVTLAAAFGTLDPEVVQVDPDGTVLGLSEGEARVIVAAGMVADTVEIQVRPLVDRIILSPDSIRFASLGESMSVDAQVLDFRGNALPTATIAWESSDPSVVSVTTTGLIRALAVGDATVAATVGSVTATVSVSVVQEPVSIVLSPEAAVLVPGDTLSFSARVNDAGGSRIPGAVFEWSSSNPESLSISEAGLATAGRVGDAVIEVRSGELVASATAVVEPGQVASLVLVSGDGQTGEAGQPLSLPVQVLALDGAGFPVPGLPVTWSASGGGSVAGAPPATNANGEIAVTWNLGPNAGEQTLTAQSNGVSVVATATAQLSGPAEITIDPDGAAFTALGQSQAFTAAVRDNAGDLIVDAVVEWSILDGAIASVTAGGTVTAQSSGATSLVAVSGLASDTVTISVTQTPDSIVVSPGAVALESVGADQQFTADVLDAGGSVIASAAVTWASDDEDVVVIDPGSGLATSTGEGTAVVSASFSGITGTATVTVAQVPASVVLDPDSVEVEPGETRQITASVLDAEGVVIPGAPVTWSSDDDAVASVSAAGLVLGEAQGTTTVQASSGSASAIANVVVVAPVPVSIEIAGGDGQTSPAGLELAAPAEVRVLSAFGQVVPGATVTWIAQNDGSTNPPSSITDGLGEAEASWALGPGLGAQSLRAAIEGDTVQFSASASGASRDFDMASGSDRVVFGDTDGDFNFPDGDWTLSLWVRPDNLAPDFQFAFAAGESPFGSGVFIYLNPDQGMRWQANLDGAGDLLLGDSEESQWQHLVLRRSGTTVTFWVDGAQVPGSRTLDAAVVPDGGSSLGMALEFGPSAFDGGIAQVTRWSTALPDATIGALAGGTHPLDVAASDRDWFVPLGRDPEERLGGTFSISVFGAQPGNAPPVSPPSGP
jgi:hypothetical protein